MTTSLGGTLDAALQRRHLGPLLVLLGLLSLALPWRNSGVGLSFAPVFVPGWCSTGYDGSYFCDPGTIQTAVTTTITGPLPGYQLPARIFVLLALAALLIALTRRWTPAAVALVPLAITALLLGGLDVTSGRVLFAGVVGAAVLLLRHAGVLRGRTLATVST